MSNSTRVTTAIHALTSVLLAWLLMQVVHEAGHMLGAWATGGHVVKVVLHPLTISRTDVAPNPNPAAEIWAGPIFGGLFPVVLWGIAWLNSSPIAFWLRFFAGFCLIANGGYLGYAVIEPIGDGEELVRLGVPIWTLGLFGLAAVSCGFWLWHGLGPEFGLGPRGRPISWTTAAISTGMLFVVIMAELILSR